jgi:hypothetical protein
MKNDELSYCVSKCGALTNAQMTMLNDKIKKGTFVGVGKIVGVPGVFPLYLLGKRLECLDACGYGQSASIEGREIYE